MTFAACTTSPTLYELKENSLKSSKAKNVILFIGDGMGVSTVTASRIFAGQSKGQSGEDYVLPFERFQNVALVKTYNSNQQVPDSAGTATAIMTGVKTKAGMISVAPQSARGDCAQAKAHHLPTLGEMAVSRDKAVGIVTTARLTHATPATVYAHSPERDWEADKDMSSNAMRLGCLDIAQQLTGFPFDLALGGGKGNFLGSQYGGNRLLPSSNLIADWQELTGGTVAYTASDMKSASPSSPLLGLFADSHMSYMIDRVESDLEPSLTEMTQAAVGRLSSNASGYFLMVEGGRIDHGHHQGKAGYALTEAHEFSRAVQSAIEMTDPDNTLILVTADHSHVFTIAGYPTRGNDILGVVKGNDKRGNPSHTPLLAADGIPYTTLGYWNGPGVATSQSQRPYPETGVKAQQQAAVPTGSGFDLTAKYSETHGGEDVAIYATGPGSNQIRGVIEQNTIFDVIVEAFDW